MSEAAIRHIYNAATHGNVISFQQAFRNEEIRHTKSNKKAGQKSEVYAFKPGDAHKILCYFQEHEMWLHYLMFVAQLSIARRNGDMLSLRWKNFFDPRTGRMREHMLEIREEKTGKFASPMITDALRDAISLYLEKTGCNPAADNYEKPVFLQLSGTARGKVISYDGCRKAIKKAALAVGIDYNVGTHSMRKTFGADVLAANPSDPRTLEMLSGFYNHADVKTTEAYTGRTKENVDAMVQEHGDFISRYIVAGENFAIKADSPTITIDSGELMTILQLAYEAGRDHANESDAMVHVEAFTDIVAMVEQAAK